MTAIDYDQAARNWATGMRLAEPYIAARREAARPVAVANRAKPKPCAVKGCKRSGGKRGVCAAHYKLVPYAERMKATMAIWDAQLRETSRQRRRLQRIAVQAAEVAPG